MGKRPLPLWSYRQDGGIDVPRPLHGDWRDEYAIVYDAAASRGIGPLEADRLEIWVLASALGANRPPEDPTVQDGLTWNERRALALERGEPEPQWDDQPLSQAEREAEIRLREAAPQVFLPPGFVMPEGG